MEEKGTCSLWQRLTARDLFSDSYHGEGHDTDSCGSQLRYKFVISTDVARLDTAVSIEVS